MEKRKVIVKIPLERLSDRLQRRARGGMNWQGALETEDIFSITRFVRPSLGEVYDIGKGELVVDFWDYDHERDMLVLRYVHPSFDRAEEGTPYKQHQYRGVKIS